LSDYRDIREPRHHPDDVKTYLAFGVLSVIGIIFLIEVVDAVRGGCALAGILDAWGLFDAALIAIASAIITYYFTRT